MTVKTWNGTTGDYASSTNWSPQGVPQSGDTAVINGGTVSVIGRDIVGVTIDLNESDSSASSELFLAPFVDAGDDNATVLAATTTLDVTSTRTLHSLPNAEGDPLLVEFGTGETDNQGTINFNSAQAEVLTQGSLVNTGAINVIGTSVDVSEIGLGAIANDGTISVVSSSSPGALSVDTPVLGNGTIQIGAYGYIQFELSVAATQLIQFNGGSGQSEEVDLDEASTFGATISGFSSGDVIELGNTNYTAATYSKTGPTSGALSIYDGNLLKARLLFSGDYSRDSFTLSNKFPNVQITTVASEPQYGALPSNFGYANRPIYRFFDTTNGTQFQTSSTNERDTVLATRSDLTAETASFSAVASSDANAAPVYRFFDTKFGTHFFTANAAERDSIIAERPDLTYEPSSTFYEHAASQPNDVAVHRFYETGTGTHFYSGSPSEIQALTAPGSASYRSDLVAEGIAFYAPSNPVA